MLSPYLNASSAWRVLGNPRLSPERLEYLQDRKVRRVVRHAYERVPYYRRLLASAGLSPHDVQTTEDLSKIPISEKDDFRAAGLEQRLARGKNPDSCFVSRTSGSSGKPLSTYLDPCEVAIRRLLGLRRLADVGCRPWDRVATLCDPVQLPAHRFRTEVVPVTLSPEEQIARLAGFNPTVLKAWPSSLAVLMHHTDGKLSRSVHPRIIALSGETCPDKLRRDIASDLGADVFAFYASGELGPMASECKMRKGMHLNADQLVVESVGDGEGGNAGDLVITSLYGFTMPFIRYRIGDSGVVTHGACQCGSPFPRLFRLQGRTSALVDLPGGRVASVSGIVNTSLRNVAGLRQFHLIQETRDSFLLLAAFFEPPSEETLNQMLRQISECLGTGVRVEIEVVETVGELGRVHKFGNFTSRLSR